MNLFYTPDIGDQNRYTLDESESKHAIRVLRMKAGDEIQLVDGKGNFYLGTIESDNPKKCEVVVVKVWKESVRPGKLHIAIAPTKNNDRLEWFVEKAVEIGISEITPILCEHSERKVLKIERLEKRAIAAMKQSMKAHLPKINKLIKFNQFIEQQKGKELYIAHCEETLKKEFKDIIQPGNEVVLLIGPEGDFSKQEIAFAIEQNAQSVSLGTSRLRTETAGIFGCAIFNLMNE